MSETQQSVPVPSLKRSRVGVQHWSLNDVDAALDFAEKSSVPLLPSDWDDIAANYNRSEQ